MPNEALEIRRARAHELRQQGLTYAQIAAEMNCSLSGVRHLIRGALRSRVGAAGIENDGVDARQFGVEIEHFGVGASTIINALAAVGIVATYEGYTHQVMRHWKIVTDGSLGYSGLELVSPPLSGAAGYEELRKVMKALRDNNAFVNGRCGMHVHHDMDGLSGEAIARFVEAYAANQDAIDRLVAPSRRRGGSHSNWCARLSPRELQLIGDQFRDTRTAPNISRYRTINVQSFPRYGTVECRQHQGTLNARKALAWVKVMQALIRAAEQGAVDNFNGDVMAMLDSLAADNGLEANIAQYLAERALSL